MNILFLSDNFPPERNASAARVYERACYWARWGHRVTVITAAPNFPEGKIFPGYANRYGVETMDGIRVVRVPTYVTANAGFARRTLDFLSYMAAAVAAGLAEDEPDLVAATSPQFFAAIGGWALARLKRVPFVFELGDLWPASIEAVGATRNALLLRALEWVELFLYRASDAVIALTRRFKEDLIRREIPPEHVAVVRNGVDLPRYGPRGRDAVLDAELGTAGRFVVGYFGTHGMAHGLGNALDAAALLSDDPRALFLFVGAGAERGRLVADATARRLSNARFVPAKPKELMPRLWSVCDIALIHLKDDPVFATVIPSKIFEAMGMGLPILLVAPDGEAREIVEETGAGVWVPAGRPALLAEAVRHLESDAALRSRLATASLAAAPSHSREEQAREVLRVFESVLAGAEPA